MNIKVIQSDLLLLLTACIWGFAFSAQLLGMNSMGPFVYNGLRFLIGFASLLPIVLLRKKKSKSQTSQTSQTIHINFDLIKGSLIIGSVLFVACSLQQLGLFWTTAGKCGFITGIYVVLVPVVGIFLGRKTGLPTWIGAFLALCGLFFVTGFASVFTKSDFDTSAINFGDILTAIGGIVWTFHVLFIDIFSKKVDPIKLSCGQFIVAGVLSIFFSLGGISELIGVHAGPELGQEAFGFSNIVDGIIPLLYGGLFSAGIAYTLQIVAQRDAPPAHACIIMSLETVFAALGGFLILNEQPGNLAIFGFILMLAGMLATQWDVITHRSY
ncbi:MAG: DMT family transporter [Termitinemataceae bacterium]|nr:MAG: DMT family transporter [Termitinemataceae bacterium]